jgi:hypothetical protein
VHLHLFQQHAHWMIQIVKHVNKLKGERNVKLG